jgi:hypothetical protein
MGAMTIRFGNSKPPMRNGENKWLISVATSSYTAQQELEGESAAHRP